MLASVFRIVFLASALLGASAPVLAQRAASLDNISLVQPVRIGGLIRVVEKKIVRQVQPGACLTGTFMSSDIMALGVPGVRVSPDAMFWPHHATPTIGGNPWIISQADDAYILARVRNPGLAIDILRQMAKFAPNSDYHFYYTGADLITRFAYTSC